MKPPLQALLIAGEEMREDVLAGRKKITIREGHRDYQVDKPVILCCDKLNWATMRKVVKVRHTKLGDITDLELRADGFFDQKDMYIGMQQYYPNITMESPVTVISWE